MNNYFRNQTCYNVQILKIDIILRRKYVFLNGWPPKINFNN